MSDKKTVAVTYIGEEDAITEAGVAFKQGKAEQVPADHPHLDKFRGNPTFEVKEG